MHRSVAQAVTFIILILALAPVTYAAQNEAFSISLDVVEDEILPNDAAEYELKVTNYQNMSDAFTVSTDDIGWIVDSAEPLSDVPNGKSRSTTLQLSAKGYVTPGARIIPIKVRSANTRTFLVENAEITVLSPNGSGGQYAPSIFLSARVPDSIDPREPFPLSVYLRNRNARDYSALIVDVASPLVSQRYQTTLGSVTGDDGEKTNQLSLTPNSKTVPGTYPLTITISVDNITVNKFETTLTVASYNTEERTSSTSGAWFKTTTSYSITNTGNSVQATSVAHPTNWFSRLFTTSPQKYEAQNNSLEFMATLEPGARVEFSVTRNFRLLAILAAILVASVVLYFVFRSPLILQKEAQIRGSSSDGVSELRIRLHVKNRSARSVNSLHVVDKVTSMADVVKEASLGTLQPSKIVRKPGHGTLVRWDIDSLDSFEERIITYTVKTKLKLIGDVYLPAAKVKFDHAGRERTAYSNEVNIDREQ